MKKVLILLACAAAIVACSKEEPIAINQGQAISFSSPFVNKATRATEVNSGNLDEFNVWGSVTGSGGTALIYNGSVITKTGELTTGGEALWACNGNPQYWVPGADYAFTAIKNYATVDQVTGQMPTAINAEVHASNGAADLILAQETVNDAIAAQPAVGLTFSHLMSKVAFTVTSTTSLTDDYKYVVSGIKVANFTSGKFTLDTTPGATPADGTWAGTGSQDISFGQITVDKDNQSKSNGSLLLIPNTNSFKVSFVVDFVKDETVLRTVKYTTDLDADFAPITVDNDLVAGHSYNFTITLDAVNPIQFTATVEPWPAKGDTGYHDVTVQ